MEVFRDGREETSDAGQEEVGDNRQGITDIQRRRTSRDEGARGRSSRRRSVVEVAVRRMERRTCSRRSPSCRSPIARWPHDFTQSSRPARRPSNREPGTGCPRTPWMARSSVSFRARRSSSAVLRARVQRCRQARRWRDVADRVRGDEAWSLGREEDRRALEEGGELSGLAGRLPLGAPGSPGESSVEPTRDPHARAPRKWMSPRPLRPYCADEGQVRLVDGGDQGVRPVPARRTRPPHVLRDRRRFKLSEIGDSQAHLDAVGAGRLQLGVLRRRPLGVPHVHDEPPVAAWGEAPSRSSRAEPRAYDEPTIALLPLSVPQADRQILRSMPFRYRRAHDDPTSGARGHRGRRPRGRDRVLRRTGTDAAGERDRSRAVGSTVWSGSRACRWSTP